MTRQKKLTAAIVAGGIVVAAGVGIATTAGLAAGPGNPVGPSAPFGIRGRGFGGGFGPGVMGLDPGWNIGLHLGFLLLALVLVLATVVWVVRTLTRAHGSRTIPTAALAELDVLYARGGVTREEYLLRRNDLLGAPSTPPPAA